jgi:hypothetical protein
MPDRNMRLMLILKADLEAKGVRHRALTDTFEDGSFRTWRLLHLSMHRWQARVCFRLSST